MVIIIFLWRITKTFSCFIFYMLNISSCLSASFSYAPTTQTSVFLSCFCYSLFNFLHVIVPSLVTTYSQFMYLFHVVYYVTNDLWFPSTVTLFSFCVFFLYENYSLYFLIFLHIVPTFASSSVSLDFLLCCALMSSGLFEIHFIPFLTLSRIFHSTHITQRIMVRSNFCF